MILVCAVNLKLFNNRIAMAIESNNEVERFLRTRIILRV